MKKKKKKKEELLSPFNIQGADSSLLSGYTYGQEVF